LILPDTARRTPTVIKLISKELPPLEINGNVIPVSGQSPVLPAMMISVWSNSMQARQAAIT
jgi:hypothetical protein